MRPWKRWMRFCLFSLHSFSIYSSLFVPPLSPLGEGEEERLRLEEDLAVMEEEMQEAQEALMEAQQGMQVGCRFVVYSVGG